MGTAGPYSVFLVAGLAPLGVRIVTFHKLAKKPPTPFQSQWTLAGILEMAYGLWNRIVSAPSDVWGGLEKETRN